MGLKYRSTHMSASTADVTTAAAQTILGPMDIRGYEILSLEFMNSATGAANAYVALTLQATNQQEIPGVSDSNVWVNVNTSVLDFPTALGASAVALTKPITNAYAWLRVRAQGTGSATNYTLTVRAGGYKRQ